MRISGAFAFSAFVLTIALLGFACGPSPATAEADPPVTPWERVRDDAHSVVLTERMRVPGGCVYRTITFEGVAQCFVPDVASVQTGCCR